MHPADPAERVNRIVVPGLGAWRLASQIVARLVEAGAIARGSVQPGFLNDCLLAAVAREGGYRIVTHNLRDSETIARVERAARPVRPFP